MKEDGGVQKVLTASPTRNRPYSERAFIRNYVGALDPGAALWSTNIPLTWRHGYETAMDDVALKARDLLDGNEELTWDSLYQHIRRLAYGVRE